MLGAPLFRTIPAIRTAGGRTRQKPTRRTPAFPAGRLGAPIDQPIASHKITPMSWCLDLFIALGTRLWGTAFSFQHLLATRRPNLSLTTMADYRRPFRGTRSRLHGPITKCSYDNDISGVERKEMPRTKLNVQPSKDNLHRRRSSHGSRWHKAVQPSTCGRIGTARSSTWHHSGFHTITDSRPSSHAVLFRTEVLRGHVGHTPNPS